MVELSDFFEGSKVMFDRIEVIGIGRQIQVFVNLMNISFMHFTTSLRILSVFIVRDANA